MTDIANPFLDVEGARRYQAFRPNYHDLPFQKLRHAIGHDVANALDVGCGTGHSTIALSKISRTVIGCDISPAMLAEARQNSRLGFVEASAEKLPFSATSFELLNISMAFHWVDHAKFLNEANRVLVGGGYLSIDNYGFTGRISENEEFQKLHYDFYDQNLPAVAKNSRYPDDSVLQSHGFQFEQEMKYEHRVLMNAFQFSNFIMTHSNFLGLSAERRKDFGEKIVPFYDRIFLGESIALPFAGTLKLYRRRLR